MLVRHIARNEELALWIASLVGLNYEVIAAASNGRMEMMCVTLGLMSVTYFVCQRERSWARAAAGSACFAAAALFCHPLGLICNGWLAAVVILHWREIRWRGLALASLPYLLGFAIYAAYVLKAPHIFLAQAREAYLYRIAGGPSLGRKIITDFVSRYWELYYAALSGAKRLKLFSLLFGVVGTVLLAANSKWRRSPLGRILLIFACISYVGVAALDNQDIPAYFTYSMPMLTGCAALWVYAEWQTSRRVFRFISGGLATAAVLAAVGGFSMKILANERKHLYMPVIEAVRSHLPPNGKVMGGSELGFALGFQPYLIDDRFLGYLSGIRPDVFVENEYYGGGGPGWLASREILQTEYHLVLQNKAYNVYVRNHDSGSDSRPK
jgi:hypothetical protein